MIAYLVLATATWSAGGIGGGAAAGAGDGDALLMSPDDGLEPREPTGACRPFLR